MGKEEGNPERIAMVQPRVARKAGYPGYSQSNIFNPERVE